MTSQYFQPLALQTSALVAIAVPSVVFVYTTGKKATDKVSHDEYCGKLCPSSVMNVTPEATALINYIVVVWFKPPLPPIPPSQHVVQLRCDWYSLIPIGATQHIFTLSYILQQSIPSLSVLLLSDSPSLHASVLIKLCLSGRTIYTTISALLILGWELLISHCYTNIGFKAAYTPSTFSALLHWQSTHQSPSVLLNLDWHCFMSFHTPDPPYLALLR
jgi:hypothetical protein